MRHIHLTCKNHPDLRWTCKEIAWSDGKYNGTRSIFFIGTVEDINKVTPVSTALECKCPASDLIKAPEEKANESV